MIETQKAILVTKKINGELPSQAHPT